LKQVTPNKEIKKAIMLKTINHYFLKKNLLSLNVLSMALLCIILIVVSSLVKANKNEPNADKNKTITVRADAWPPYNDQPNSKLPGYMIEIAEYAFKKNGYQLDYQLLSWERSLEQVATGEIDCVVGAYKSEARNFIFPKNSFGEEYVAFYG